MTCERESLIKQGLKIICLVPQKFWENSCRAQKPPPHNNTIPTVIPRHKHSIQHHSQLTHNTLPTQTNTATTLTTQGVQPSYTQKVCHTNSPHTGIPTHRNIRPTQGEKLTQSMFPTHSSFTHTLHPTQKESSLVVSITNITSLCRQGMSFTQSHSKLLLHNCNTLCAFCEDM